MSETRRKEKGNAETASGCRAASISRTADLQGNQPFSKIRAARKDMTFGKQAFYNPYPLKMSLNIQDVDKGKACLNNLFQQFHKINSNGISYGGMTDLFSELDSWRKIRNKCIHSIVKSYPGKPTENINNFLEDACIAALKGKRLCRILSDWCVKGRE